MAQVRSILIIKPSSLGDVLHVFPALEVLKRAYPACEFDFFINPEFAPLLDYSPVPIRRRILFPRKALGKLTSFAGAFCSLLRELRRDRYDLVIDFQGLIRSAFFGFLARGSRFAGFADPAEPAARFFYQEKIPVDPALHAVLRNAGLVFGLTGEKNGTVPEITVPAGPAPDSALLAKLPARFVVMAPGARWESKAFPPELFAAVAGRIFEQLPGVSVILTGTKADAPAAAVMRRLMPSGVPLLDLTGKTSITELCEIMRRCAAAVTNDSGPMHIAALMGTHVFALLGPTRPELTGPWGRGHRVFRNEKLSCLGCLLRRCPADSACRQLDADVIAAEIIACLKKEDQK